MDQPEAITDNSATAQAKAAKAAMQKAGLMQAISQLDMLLTVFGEAPERVKTAATEFRNALKEWSENA